MHETTTDLAVVTAVPPPLEDPTKCDNVGKDDTTETGIATFPIRTYCTGGCPPVVDVHGRVTFTTDC